MVVSNVFRGPADAGGPNLIGVEGVRSVVGGDEEVLEIERHDSPDLRLAAAGIVLARHLRGEVAHWQVDLPDGEPVRIPGGGREVPAELVELVRGTLRGAALAPVGQIRRVRSRESLRDGRSREIAAIGRDEVQLATLGASTAVANWAEFRVTVDGGPAGLAAALTERVAETGALPAEPVAEEELADMLRRTASRPPRRATGKKGSAGAALLGYLGKHADRLAAADLGARRDEQDGVHQVRVAARRMRSALVAHRGLLAGGGPGVLAEELRWLGRELAPARDLEVQEERITRALDALPPDLVLGPVRAQLTRYFARARAEARAAALAALDSDRYAALREALERFLVDPPLARAAGSKKGLEPGIAKAEKRFRRRLRAARGGDDVAIHSARKAGKRARYAVEVSGRKAKKLKARTQALGEHQDAVVGRGILRELGAAAHRDGENGFTFGVLYARERG